MTSVTVEFRATNPPKTIHREFKTREAAVIFLTSLSGENILGYLDDGSFSMYAGYKAPEKGNNWK